ncbi:MAG: 3-oxoacyl-[acyl-carrier-protein] reductase FabG [Paracidovorax wautersii]|uniref:3-oxoacyl-[acyl-carrier-protein] reductase FabG n=1 Tax=Paracidovorax wautersii TaxID=1177982 RepID=A0A7V8FQM8_9BURK|nr:MAG: 3-oxoacyl-[acyl-carrier-protein] reductase FabG [Paracidovorax wautersii]
MTRRVIVTGAAGGIGSAICLALAREAGARGQPLHLAAFGSRASAAMDGLLEQLAALGTEAQAFYADLTDHAAATEAVRQAIAWAGGLDTLVSNAGQSRPSQLATLPLVEWDRCFALNTRATWSLAQAAHGALAASRGSITAVASMSGLHPHPGYGAYSAAKAALIMLCQQLALEWGRDGIRVNTVCPGMIRTPLTEAVYLDNAVKARRETLVPLGRIGQAQDIAQAVRYLASEDASYVTGSNLVVDGGIASNMLAQIPGRPDKVR